MPSTLLQNLIEAAEAAERLRKEVREQRAKDWAPYRLDILELLITYDLPMSTDQVGNALGIPRHVANNALRSLMKSGHVDVTQVRAGKRLRNFWFALESDSAGRKRG